jgi:dolichol-phosphate mannosyltransferase
VRLSIVIPFHNERAALPLVIDEVVSAFREQQDWEAIFIDDASTDGSARVISDRALPRATVGRLECRGGPEAAVRKGLSLASGRIVAVVDADHQYAAGDLIRLVAAIEAGADIAVGNRIARQDPSWRRAASRLLNAFLGLVSGLPVQDAFCGLRCFRRSAIEKVGSQSQGAARYLALRAQAAGLRVVSVPVSHRPRLGGGSRYSLGMLVVLAARDLMEAARLRFSGASHGVR